MFAGLLMQQHCRIMNCFWVGIRAEMHGDTEWLAGFLPWVNAVQMVGSTEAEMPAGEMFNRLIVHIL